MTLKELWNVTPLHYIWIEDKFGNTINTYEGEAYGEAAVIENIRVKQTPNHGHVLAVRLKEVEA